NSTIALKGADVFSLKKTEIQPTAKGSLRQDLQALNIQQDTSLTTTSTTVERIDSSLNESLFDKAGDKTEDQTADQNSLDSNVSIISVCSNNESEKEKKEIYSNIMSWLRKKSRGIYEREKSIETQYRAWFKILT
ncbi:hypothetical protein Bhyg_03074, partial [Pseudolycoriella hygida]